MCDKTFADQRNIPAHLGTLGLAKIYKYSDIFIYLFFGGVCVRNCLRVITRKVLNILLPLSEPLLLDLSSVRENKPL